MAEAITLERVEALAAQLQAAERLQLIARLAEKLAAQPVGLPAVTDWMSLRGAAPDLLSGEDAQGWVSRTRRDADEQREKQWRPGS